ncbi:MAG: transglutaminase family protein [Phycisphaerales bacterium]
MNARLSTVAVSLFAIVASALLGAASPPLSDIIKRVDPEDYQLEIMAQITAYQHDYRADIQYEFELEETPLVFPIVKDGGFHVVDMDKLKAELQLNDITIRDSFSLLPTPSLDTTLGRFQIREFKGKQVEFQITEILTCYASKVDESAALSLGWPEEWPPDVQSALQPQMYVESSHETVQTLMNRMTKENPRRAKPYVLAKELARQTVNYFQVNGKDWTNDKFGAVDGINVSGAVKAAQERRGPLVDAVCLYVALCRAAGLPARPVIGLDTTDDDKLIFWAEIYLPTAGWIPVDLREVYKAPGRARDLSKPWPGVGTHDDLNEMVPIAFHFHPPAGVIAGGRKGKPLIWGWAPRPSAVPADQTVRFDVNTAPRRGGERRRR